MSTITQSSLNSQYATSASTAQIAGAATGSTSKSQHKKTGNPKRHHHTELSRQMQAQQKLFQQLLEMMTSFMQDTIKKLTEMFQGMVDPSASGATDAPSGQTSSSDTGSSTGAAGTDSSATDSASTDSGTSIAGSCGTGSCDGSSGSDSPNSSDSSGFGTTSGRSLEAAVDDQGCVTVLTEDGFKIQCEGKDQAWTITRPDGAVTRIWGDPHVHESDGDNWDFKERSTFKFGDNKITVETVPAPNGQTYSSTITVYNGDERVTITGLDQNSPKLVAVGGDGKLHDAQLSDGDTYVIGQESNGQEQWTKDGAAVAVTNSDPQVAPTAAN